MFTMFEYASYILIAAIALTWIVVKLTITRIPAPVKIAEENKHMSEKNQ